jgi:bifunctional DNase/RNase
MLFQKESEAGEIIDDGDGMIVAIGGDTFQAIVLLLQGRLEIRPLTVDLLCRFLEQARGSAENDWSIVRVAITDLAESTFIGRIFFGDRTSEEIKWDVDARPSDSVFLALKYGAPIFIHKKVWDAVAAPLEELKETAQWQMAHVNRELKAHRQGDEYEGAVLSGGNFEQQAGRTKLDVARLMTTVRRSDPEPLKLLKMELKVAIAEEDYAAAARIRDHVFMKLSVAAATASSEGDHEAAANYEKTLRGYITSMDEGGLPDHSDGTGEEV